MTNGTSPSPPLPTAISVFTLMRVRTGWPGTLTSGDLSWGLGVGFRKDIGPCIGVQKFCICLFFSVGSSQPGDPSKVEKLLLLPYSLAFKLGQGVPCLCSERGVCVRECVYPCMCMYACMFMSFIV